MGRVVWILSAVLAWGVCRPAAGVAAQGGRSKRLSHLYEQGAQLYATGQLQAALGVYLEIRRQDPGSRTAELSVGRIRMELAGAATEPQRPAPAPSSADDPLAGLAAWYNFDRTLGDALGELGTMSARGGRIAQLLAERRLARDRRAPFPKDHELHALLRRLPVG